MEWRGSCASDFFPHDRIRPIESRLVGSTDFATKLPELYEAVAKMGGAEFLNAGSVISTDGVDGLHLTAASEAEARSCRCREGEGDGSRAGPPERLRDKRAHPCRRVRIQTRNTGSDPTRWRRKVSQRAISAGHTRCLVGLPWHAAHVMGSCAGAVRSGDPDCPDDLSGRPGFRRRERGSSGTERDG
jgi:hypothetical protein